MTTPGPVQPHSRVTLSGIFGPTATPYEIWSWGVNTTAFLTPNQTNLAALANGTQAAYATHLAPLYKSDVVLLKTRAAAVSPSGTVSKDAEGGYEQFDNVTSTPGTNSGTAVSFPLQTALVVSLQTGRAGPSGKGRFFLPWPSAMALSEGFRLSDANAATVRTGVRNFLLAVRAAAGDQASLLVVSYKGFASPVTSVAVGRTPDTMRSRRNAIKEGKIFQAL